MSRPRRRVLIAAAVAALPSAALAATYDLSFQSVNIATAPYTTDDTLNLNGVTFTSSISNATLPPSLNLLGSTTVNSGANITLAGLFTGTGSFTKSGTGSLTLSAASPSYTGPVTINSGGTIRLADPLALGPASASTPITLSGTLDASGALPVRPLYFSTSSALLANNTATPATIGPSVSISTNSVYITLGGTGDLTFAGQLPTFTGTIKHTGTGTLTYATATNLSYSGQVTVSSGTLSLGINAPFSGSGGIFVASGAALDLNGFNSVGTAVSLASGATLVNNNTSVTPSISLTPFTATGTFTTGGAGDINFTTRATSFTKIGSGTVTLSAGYSGISNGTLTVNAGTVRLNNANALGNASSSPTINLNSTSNIGGVLDLNGYPAPAGTYNFNGGILANDNTATPSVIDLTTAHASGSQPLMFGGAGDLVVTGFAPSAALYKFGPGTGTLTLNNTGSLNLNATVLAGALRLSNSAANAYYGSVSISGSSPQFPFRATTLDFNGLTPPTSLTINLYNNGGLVNNNTSTSVTITSSVVIKIQDNYLPPMSGLVFGGDGTLAISSTSFSFPYTVTLNKVGEGLLTIPASFSPKGVAIRGGILQAETNAQLGGNYTNAPISFLGGTLRIAPLYLTPQSSYTFTSPISVDPAGGTLDTQRNSTFTGLLTGAGPFTKTGSASASLNPDPSSRLALTIGAGLLRLAPAAGTPALTSLTLSPGASLDIPSTGLIIDYTGPSPADTLCQYLQSGQLFSSSSAAADPNHRSALACVEASALGLTSFNGQPLATPPPSSSPTPSSATPTSTAPSPPTTTPSSTARLRFRGPTPTGPTATSTTTARSPAPTTSSSTPPSAKPRASAPGSSRCANRSLARATFRSCL